MMNEIKKNELNEMELDNVTGGAFRSISLNQNETSDAADIEKRQAISFLRTDSMR